ncbi:MAG: ribonuclease J, partial [Armatimonadetes bacterium]|nr:ribonuclease J [Armatimonadota bacterium]
GRLAAGRNRRFDLQAGDTVIVSANPIPGNEETVARTINRLIQRGANVIYDPLKQVHVSGHASSEEQKLMIGLIRPKFFVPVHGELRMLVAHSELAKEMGIPQENILVVENGTPIELTENKITAGERIPGGYVYVVLTDESGKVLASTDLNLEGETLEDVLESADGPRADRTGGVLRATAPVMVGGSPIGYLRVDADR